MTTLTFRGRFADAAMHLLRNTPLGSSPFVTVVGTADVVTVEVRGWSTFSSGEMELIDFLSSLANGRGRVDLHQLIANTDDDCQWAAWWAFGLATGHVTATTPVRFEEAT